MMRVSMLIDEEDEQMVVGTFVLKDGKVSVESASKDGLPMMREILTERIFVHGSEDEYVNASQHPEAWMRELPWMYNGSRLRAALEE